MRSARPLTGRTVAFIAAGFFLVMLAANLAMVSAAFQSWTGLATSAPYERGLKHNRALAEARTQAELGWTAEIAYDGARVSVLLRDRDGAPIEDASLRAALIRPVASGHDVTAALEAEQPGRYGAAMPAPLHGQWDITVEAHKDGAVWRTAQRVTVP